MSYFTECEPSKCSTDRETVPELHALVRRAATLASVTIVLEFNRFLDARRSQRASLVIGFDLHVRVISNSFSSFGLLEVPCGSIGFFWVSWGSFGSFGFLRVP